MSHPLDDILHAQKHGECIGITSVCSSHPFVLKTTMQHAVDTDSMVLVESTCNQVNQYGGYSGMTPEDYASFVLNIASQNGLPPERIILGGDHLGPHVWQSESADSAMQKAVELVMAYAKAGYTKIHFDTSMHLGGDDTSRPLDPELAAQRTVQLVQAVGACSKSLKTENLRYVVGTEVPVPGGAISPEHVTKPTIPSETRDMLDCMQSVFKNAALESAWEHVIAVVVQPGVEFGDDFILEYYPEAAQELVRFSEGTSLVYEAHSTDYQNRDSLRNLVRDHFAILKVGPALTFAFREAVFALAMIEDELTTSSTRSNMIQVLDDVMVQHPVYWEKYYSGTPSEQAFKRKFSLSDRIRYYWTDSTVQSAYGKLLVNLGEKPLPLTLLNQFAPLQWEKVRSGFIQNSPRSLIHDRIKSVLEDYAYACKQVG